MANDELEHPAQPDKPQKRIHAGKRDDSDLLPGHTWDRFKGTRMGRRFRGGDGKHTNGYSDQLAADRAYGNRGSNL